MSSIIHIEPVPDRYFSDNRWDVLVRAMLVIAATTGKEPKGPEVAAGLLAAGAVRPPVSSDLETKHRYPPFDISPIGKDCCIVYIEMYDDDKIVFRNEKDAKKQVVG
jgi:hypothetical protein